MSSREARLALANLWVAVGAFGLAAMMGVMQGQSRTNTALPFRSPKLFYLSVTAHGVLMALVFTTFFIMGLGYVLCRTTLDRPLAARRLAWASFWVAGIGTAAAAATILLGKATVLYTFYPPLQAHPLFYIGATLLVVGSWGWGVVMLLNVRAWRREHPEAPAAGDARHRGHRGRVVPGDRGRGGGDAVPPHPLVAHLSALGGSILFVSAMSFVLVLVMTAVGKTRETGPSFEYSEALEKPATRTTWDRLGLWTAVAVVLVLLAYGWPIWDLLQLERFGSRGFVVP